jgi:predicted house-cleaning noncanonical NTP pyrophosphatase (MazG superfamily)
MAYTKARKAFDDETREFVEELLSDEFKTLRDKPERTEEENSRFVELTNTFNSEYQEFLIQKGNEEIEGIKDSFTMDEYSEILDVNSGNDVEINGNKIPAVDFMELFCDMFVQED